MFLDHFTSSIYFWPLHTEICPIFFSLLMISCTVDDAIFDIFVILHSRTCFSNCSTISTCRSCAQVHQSAPHYSLRSSFYTQSSHCWCSSTCFFFSFFFALFPTCWRHFAAIKFKVRQEFSWNTKTCQYEHWILWISRTAVVTLSCTQLWDFNPKQPESFSFVTLTESRSRRLLETFVYSNTDIYLTCTFSPCCSM